MELSRLYLITDRTQTLGRPLVDVVKSAIDGGVKLIQLREKDLSGRELFSIAKELRQLTNQYGAKLLINDRVDIALAVGADGVHLGRQSISVQDARQAFSLFNQLTAPSPQPPIIGVSTHSIEEAVKAERDGADFITFGPIYHTPSKAKYGDPVGIERLREVVSRVNIPVYALGGIKMESVDEVMRAGAFGISLISAIMAAKDVKKGTEKLLMMVADHQS